MCRYHTETQLLLDPIDFSRVVGKYIHAYQNLQLIEGCKC